MARNENPPFQRGQTFYDGNVPASTDATYNSFQNLEGKEWVFEDIDYTPGATGVKKERTGRPVRCRVVRNVSTTLTLLPKRLVSFASAAYGREVDGYADVTAQHCYPVDEFLVNGAAPGDYFYIVIEGPATVLTDLAGGANNVINVGDRLVSLTAATSGATTAGRARTLDQSGATAPLSDNTSQFFARALSAATTANTNTGILCDVGHW